MLLNSSQMLMPAKALNPRSLLFTCCSKRGVTQHQIGISLWNYQEDNFIYIYKGNDILTVIQYCLI